MVPFSFCFHSLTSFYTQFVLLWVKIWNILLQCCDSDSLFVVQSASVEPCLVFLRKNSRRQCRFRFASRNSAIASSWVRSLQKDLEMPMIQRSRLEVERGTTFSIIFKAWCWNIFCLSHIYRRGVIIAIESQYSLRAQPSLRITSNYIESISGCRAYWKECRGEVLQHYIFGECISNS